MCLDALNSFRYVHWCVDIVNFKDEVLIFMDIVMVSPTGRYLLPRWIPIWGIVASHIQRKGVTTIPHKRLVPSSCVKIFSSICRQSVGIFHTYARKAWAHKLKEGLLVQWRWFSIGNRFLLPKDAKVSSIEGDWYNLVCAGSIFTSTFTYPPPIWITNVLHAIDNWALILMGCLLVLEVGHQPFIVQFSVQIFVLPFSNPFSLMCSVAVKFDKLHYQSTSQ
jgi:hypothetical protein